MLQTLAAEGNAQPATPQPPLLGSNTGVSDDLIAPQRVRESREKLEALVGTLEDRVRLAYLRYRGEVDTQLYALDADHDLFQAQLDLAQLRMDDILTVVRLYKALGGGWQ